MFKSGRKSVRKVVAFSLCLMMLFSVFMTAGVMNSSAVSPTVWATDKDYAVGNVVYFESKVYECTLPHRSQPGWEPPNAAALWKSYSGPVDTPVPTVAVSTPTPTTNVPTEGSKISGYINVDFQYFNSKVLAGFVVAVQGTSLSATTDTKGYYEINNVPASSSNKTLTVKKPCYLTRTVSNVPGNASSVIVGPSSNPMVMWAGDLPQSGSISPDGAINMADIVQLITAFNTASSEVNYNEAYDFNGDGAVNMADILIIVQHFNLTSADYPAPEIIVTTPLPSPVYTNTPTTTPTPTISIPPSKLGSKLLVGYWHNFDNKVSSVLRLKDVSLKWDVINVAFGETTNDRAVVEFSPFNCTDDEFISDVQYLKSKGKKVVLSIGGQNGVLLLGDETARKKFIDSMSRLIDKYGFQGIDIDLESGSHMDVSGADADFKNPKNPQLVNLIAGCKALCEKYGPDFILSMAPEVSYVQGGITAYGGNWGGYLPVIYGLKDRLTYIHVQHYNAGGNEALDGNFYNQATADFQVAMVDMLLKGFPIAHNPNNMFPPLRPDQIMIGIPATGPAAPSGGYINPSEMKKALDYIIKGVSYGGKYKLDNKYPEFRGLMTWSVNWDVKAGYEFTNNYRAYFDALPK